MEKKNPAPGATGDGAGFGMRVSAECGLINLRNQAEQRLRRQHLIERIHRLGARVVFELLDELDRHHGLGDDLDRRLEGYAALDQGLLATVGGDRFPALPIRLVGGVR